MGHRYDCRYSGQDCERGCECDDPGDGFGDCQYFTPQKAMQPDYGVKDVERGKTTAFLRYCFGDEVAGRQVRCCICQSLAAEAGERAVKLPRSIYNNSIKTGYVCKECAAWVIDWTMAHLVALSERLELPRKEAIHDEVPCGHCA